MGSFLYALGLVFAIGGFLWIVVKAFGESILWGLGCFFLPFVAWIYSFINWSDLKVPFLIHAAGIVMVFLSGDFSITWG
jgi:hypothetical protein